MRTCLGAFTLLCVATTATARTLTLGDDRVSLQPRDAALTQLAGDAGAPGLWLWSLAEPIRQPHYDVLRSAGLTPLQAVTGDTLLLQGPAAALRGLPERSYLAPLPAAAKHVGPLAGGPLLLLAPTVVALDLRVLPEAAGARELRGPARVGVWQQWRVDAELDTLAALSRHPAVLGLQAIPPFADRGERSAQIYASRAAPGAQPLPGYRAWLAAQSIGGTPLTLAAVDSGLDQQHLDLSQRMAPCVGISCGGMASTAHGTHTAGILVGSGNINALDADGFLRGLGVAPEARIVEQVYTALAGQPGGFLTLMRESVQNGAAISNNSWGGAATTGYDQFAVQVDVGTRDVDPNQPGDQPLAYVLAVANGFGGVSSQGTPDEAKSAITVGAHQVVAFDGTGVDWRNLADRSAHGPARDGRRLPLTVAPGCFVDSTIPNNGHFAICGTSMAAPHVAGGLALFAQDWRARRGVLPSPALLRAALAVSAEDLVGALDASSQPLGHRPDSRQGYGRARLDRLLALLPEAQVLDQVPAWTFEDAGRRLALAFTARNPGQPVTLVLAWTDAPGLPLGGATPALVNDLDLSVRVGGQRYRGGQFGAGGFSVPGGESDALNPLELIALPSAAGPIEVEIHARALPGDALPNTGDDTQQDFTLLCSNCLWLRDPAFEDLLADGFEAAD
jgi:serine protease AprX